MQPIKPNEKQLTAQMWSLWKIYAQKNLLSQQTCCLMWMNQVFSWEANYFSIPSMPHNVFIGPAFNYCQSLQCLQSFQRYLLKCFIRCCILNSTQISSIMYIRRGICLSCLQNSKNVAKTCHFEALHYYLSESVHLKNVSKIDVDNLFLSLSQTRPRGCFNVNHPLLPLTFRNSFNMIWNFSVVSFMRLSAENLPTSSFIANV